MTAAAVELQDVGAGDWRVGEGDYIARNGGTDKRWGVYQYTGRGWTLRWSCAKRADAVKSARSEWRKVLRELKARNPHLYPRRGYGNGY